MRLPAAAGLAILLATCLPAAAQSLFSREAEDREGLLVSVEWFGSTLSNGAFEYALDNVPPPPASSLLGGGGGDIVALEFDSEGDLRGALGWDFGKSYGTVAVRFWSSSTSQTGEVNRGVNSLLVGELLIPPTFFDGRVDAAMADATVDVTSIDVEYGLEMGRSKRGSGYFRVGLRSFSYEQEMTADYFLQGALIDRAVIRSEVDGIGPLVGLGGRLGLGKWIRLTGDLGAAYLLGEMDYGAEWFVTDQTLFDNRFSLRREKEERGLLQLEGSVGVASRVWKDLELAVGYRFISLQEITRRANAVDDVNVNLSVFTEEDVTYDGPYFSVTWAGPVFGRR